ncbi:MAG: phosphatidate cytidylyltransferase [Gammaproteobacteria bacterium]|jgi:phosphatidate cytidylyltransferase
MLKQRVLTAIVLALVFAGTILFAGNAGASLLFSLALFVAVRELLALTVKPGENLGIAIALAFSLLFWMLNLESGIRVNFYFAFVGSLLWVGILSFMLRYQFNGKWSNSVKLLHLVAGFALLWICGNGLLFLHRHFDAGGWILLYTLTLVWVADIGAYFAGKRFGRNKLAPSISPGKTREGVVGGIASNLAWMLIVYWLSGGWGMALWQFLIIGLCTSLISVVGDLYESVLKREASVKDSGTLLPGHGGVLDRIDGVIAATPVFIFGLYVVGVV